MTLNPPGAPMFLEMKKVELPQGVIGHLLGALYGNLYFSYFSRQEVVIGLPWVLAKYLACGMILNLMYTYWI